MSAPHRFSQAQMHALCAMQDARPGEDQSWIRANTLRSLRGLWWEQNGVKLLNSEGDAAFEAAGGYSATWGWGSPGSVPVLDSNQEPVSIASLSLVEPLPR